MAESAIELIGALKAVAVVTFLVLGAAFVVYALWQAWHGRTVVDPPARRRRGG
jgi:hypothetical protein